MTEPTPSYPQENQLDPSARNAEHCLKLPLRQLSAVAHSLHELAQTCGNDPLAELCLLIARGAEASPLRLTEPVPRTRLCLRLVAALKARADVDRFVVVHVLCLLESRLRRGVPIRSADSVALLRAFEDESPLASAIRRSLGESDRGNFERALQRLPASCSGTPGDAPCSGQGQHRRTAIEQARRLYRLLRPFRRAHGDVGRPPLSFVGMRKAELQYATWREHAHVADLHPLEASHLGAALARRLAEDPGREAVLVAVLFFLELTPAQLRAVYRGPAQNDARICAGRFVWPAAGLRKKSSRRHSAHQIPSTAEAGFALPAELVAALGPDPETPVRLDIALGLSDELVTGANELLTQLTPHNRPLTVSRLMGFSRVLIDATDDEGLAVAMTARFALASPSLVHYVFAPGEARNAAARAAYRRLGFSGELANPLSEAFALNPVPGDEDLRAFLDQHLRAIEAIAAAGVVPNAGAVRLVQTYCRLGVHVGVVLQLLAALRACRVLPFLMSGIDLARGFAVVWDKASSGYWARRPVGLCTLAVRAITTYLHVACVIARRLRNRGHPQGAMIAASLSSDSAQPLLNVVLDGRLRPIGAHDLRPHFAAARLDLNCGRRITQRLVREQLLSSVVASAQVGHGFEGQEAFGIASALVPAHTLAAAAWAWDRKLEALQVSLPQASIHLTPPMAGAVDLRLLPTETGAAQACPFPADLGHRLRVAQRAHRMVAKQPPGGLALLVVSLVLHDGICHPGLLRAALKAMFQDGIHLPRTGEAVRLVVAQVPGVGLRNVRLGPETLRAAALLPVIDVTQIDAAVQSALVHAGEYCHGVLALGATAASAVTTLLATAEATWAYWAPGIVRAFARLELVGRATCTAYVLGSSTHPRQPARPSQAQFAFDGDHGARLCRQMQELRAHLAGVARASTSAAGQRKAREGIQVLMDRPGTAEMVRECCSVARHLLGKPLEHATLASYVTAIEFFVAHASRDLDMSFADLDLDADYAAWQRDAPDDSVENRRKRGAMLAHLARHLGLAGGARGAREAVKMRRAVPGLRIEEVMAARHVVLRDPHVPVAIREDAARIGLCAAQTGGRFGEVVHLRAGDVRHDGREAIVWFSKASGAKEKSDNANRVVAPRATPEQVAAWGSTSGRPAAAPLFSTVRQAEQAAAIFVAALRAVAPRDGVRFHTLRALFATQCLLAALPAVPEARPSLRLRALLWSTAYELGHHHAVVTADHYFFEVDELLRTWWDLGMARTPASDALLGALVKHSRVNVRQRRHRSAMHGRALLQVLLPERALRRSWLVRSTEDPMAAAPTQGACAGGRRISSRDLIAYLCARHSAGSALLAAAGTALTEAQIGEVELSLSYLRRLGRHEPQWPQIRGDWCADDKDWVLRIAMALEPALRSDLSVLSLCASARTFSFFTFSAPEELQWLPVASSLANSHAVQLRIGSRQQKDAWEGAAAACGVFSVVVGDVPPGTEAMLRVRQSLPSATGRRRRDEHDYVWAAAVAALVVGRLAGKDDAK